MLAPLEVLVPVELDELDELVELLEVPVEPVLEPTVLLELLELLELEVLDAFVAALLPELPVVPRLLLELELELVLVLDEPLELVELLALVPAEDDVEAEDEWPDVLEAALVVCDEVLFGGDSGQALSIIAESRPPSLRTKEKECLGIG